MCPSLLKDWKSQKKKLVQDQNKSKNLQAESCKELLPRGVSQLSLLSPPACGHHFAMASTFPNTSALRPFSSPRAQVPVNSWMRTLHFRIVYFPGGLAVQEALTYGRSHSYGQQDDASRSNVIIAPFPKLGAFSLKSHQCQSCIKLKVLGFGTLLALHLQREWGLPGPAAPVHLYSSSPGE